MRMRATNLLSAAENQRNRPKTQYRHPHPQYSFQPAVEPTMRIDGLHKGVRYRTVMVANIPSHMRDEQQLKEYFEYYLIRKIAKPTIGINTSTQPGLINRWISFFWNRLRRIPLDETVNLDPTAGSSEDGHTAESSGESRRTTAVERVTIVRRTSQLASLLERREEVLRVLETAHIRLACKVIAAVAKSVKEKSETSKGTRVRYRHSAPLLGNVRFWKNEKNQGDVEDSAGREEQGGENRTDLLVRKIGPFVREFSQARCLPPFSWTSLHQKPRSTDGEQTTEENGQDDSDQSYDHHEKHKTIWDALLSLPRSVLDPYQPLIHLNSLFRGKAIPTIDYYTAKLRVLTSLITEAKSLPLTGYDPVSTAFVTFESPKDARRACKYLAVHPDNPLVCTVSMAPLYEDIDWTRIMKLPYNLEVRVCLLSRYPWPTPDSHLRIQFFKDWVIGLGVWYGF